jgi:hypothetical protein
MMLAEVALPTVPSAPLPEVAQQRPPTVPEFELLRRSLVSCRVSDKQVPLLNLNPKP